MLFRSGRHNRKNSHSLFSVHLDFSAVVCNFSCIDILQDAELQQTAMMMEPDKNDKTMGVNNLKRMYAKMGKNFTEAEIQQLNLSFAEGKLKQVN